MYTNKTNTILRVLHIAKLYGVDTSEEKHPHIITVPKRMWEKSDG